MSGPAAEARHAGGGGHATAGWHPAAWPAPACVAGTGARVAVSALPEQAGSHPHAGPHARPHARPPQANGVVDALKCSSTTGGGNTQAVCSPVKPGMPPNDAHPFETGEWVGGWAGGASAGQQGRAHEQQSREPGSGGEPGAAAHGAARSGLTERPHAPHSTPTLALPPAPAAYTKAYDPATMQRRGTLVHSPAADVFCVVMVEDRPVECLLHCATECAGKIGSRCP